MIDKHRKLLRETAKEYDDAVLFGISPSVESFVKLRDALGACVETLGETVENKIIRLSHKAILTDEERAWLAHHNR